MQRIATLILTVFALSFFAGCNICDEYSVREETVKVELQLSVATAEMPGAASTRGQYDYELPACNGEKINTLRVIIVRPSGEVEHNEYIGNLSEPAIRAGYYKFAVTGQEEKKIYLFVNEHAQRLNYDNQLVDIVGYDFSRITVGSRFPTAAIEALTIDLNYGEEQLKHGEGRDDVLLPMSEKHSVYVGKEDMQEDLYVTRAATKFTYIIANNSNYDYNLAKLSIEMMAQQEYYLPHGTIKYTAVSDDYNTLGQMDLSNYEVPQIGNNRYYVFNRQLTQTLSAGSSVTLAPIYLLEGKYTDPNGDPRNYKTALTLTHDYTAADGNTITQSVEMSNYFDRLKQLPRNTHVVVYVTIKPAATEWEVDLQPYTQVELTPEFGI